LPTGGVKAAAEERWRGSGTMPLTVSACCYLFSSRHHYSLPAAARHLLPLSSLSPKKNAHSNMVGDDIAARRALRRLWRFCWLAATPVKERSACLKRRARLAAALGSHILSSRTGAQLRWLAACHSSPPYGCSSAFSVLYRYSIWLLVRHQHMNLNHPRIVVNCAAINNAGQQRVAACHGGKKRTGMLL